MKKTILFFVSVILFSAAVFSQAKDTVNKNDRVLYITVNPYPNQQPQYIPQQKTDLFNQQPKTFGEALLQSIRDHFGGYSRYTGNYNQHGSYYQPRSYTGNYDSYGSYYQNSWNHSNWDTTGCTFCFDYSPEIHLDETLVTTLKVSELCDTAKINAIQKQYLYFRVGKKVYDMYGVLIEDSVPIFAREDDKVVALKKITIPKTKS